MVCWIMDSWIMDGFNATQLFHARHTCHAFHIFKVPIQPWAYKGMEQTECERVLMAHHGHMLVRTLGWATALHTAFNLFSPVPPVSQAPHDNYARLLLRTSYHQMTPNQARRSD